MRIVLTEWEHRQLEEALPQRFETRAVVLAHPDVYDQYGQTMRILQGQRPPAEYEFGAVHVDRILAALQLRFDRADCPWIEWERAAALYGRFITKAAEDGIHCDVWGKAAFIREPATEPAEAIRKVMREDAGGI